MQSVTQGSFGNFYAINFGVDFSTSSSWLSKSICPPVTRIVIAVVLLPDYGVVVPVAGVIGQSFIRAGSSLFT